MGKKFRAVGGLDTPYKKARKVWDDRLGTSSRRAQVMTHFAFFCVVLALMSSVTTFLFLKKPRVIPYIVEIDSTGRVSNYGKLLQEGYSYTPSLSMLRHHIRRFITDFREISSDIVVVKRNGFDAFKLVTQRGANILINYIREENPLELSQTITRDVKMLNFLEISENSYTASWKEITYNLAGEEISRINFRATFVIIRKTDLTEEELFRNPTGLYIDTFAIAEDRDDE